MADPGKGEGEVVDAVPLLHGQLRTELNGRIDETSSRLDQINSRLDETNVRLERLEKTVQAGFDGMAKWLETIAHALTGEKFERIEGRLVALERRVFRKAGLPKPKKPARKH